MGLAVEDAYRRLISPSVEVEVRMELKTRADEEAIAIFGKNLEALLLQPPAGGRTVLGVDPGFRTGCKLAVVSRTGALLATGVVYLHQEDRARRELAPARPGARGGAGGRRQRDGEPRVGQAGQGGRPRLRRRSGAPRW